MSTSTTQTSDERRAFKRVPSGLRVVEIDGPVKYFQYATNISEGGMFLEGLDAREEGKKMTFVFIPPGHRVPHSVEAVVVGNMNADSRRGTHVRFLDAEGSDLRERIKEYVEHRP